jgi:hypothetical protein
VKRLKEVRRCKEGRCYLKTCQKLLLLYLSLEKKKRKWERDEMGKGKG